jgi:hypothetical protein
VLGTDAGNALTFYRRLRKPGDVRLEIFKRESPSPRAFRPDMASVREEFSHRVGIGGHVAIGIVIIANAELCSVLRHQVYSGRRRQLAIRYLRKRLRVDIPSSVFWLFQIKKGPSADSYVPDRPRLDY